MTTKLGLEWQVGHLCVIVHVFIGMGIAGRGKSKGIVKETEAYWEAQSTSLENNRPFFFFFKWWERDR